MKILITGSQGQLGRALRRNAPDHYPTPVALDRTQLDIRQPQAIEEAMIRYSPEVVINTAAYTAVDRAESDKEAAFAINALAPESLAKACRQYDCRLIHVSTDFVFSGQQSTPYHVTDSPVPLSVYGASKLAGEQAIQAVFPEKSVMIRTAWLYDAEGSNFVNTMLRLMKERSEIRVVADQIGSPTWVNTLAEILWKIVARPDLKGVFHWTDAGTASWYDFAVAIYEEAYNLGVLSHPVTLWPIATADYPTPASRPAYSVLDKSALYSALNLCPQHWRKNLRHMLQEKIR